MKVRPDIYHGPIDGHRELDAVAIAGQIGVDRVERRCRPIRGPSQGCVGCFEIELGVVGRADVDESSTQTVDCDYSTVGGQYAAGHDTACVVDGYGLGVSRQRRTVDWRRRYEVEVDVAGHGGHADGGVASH